MIEQWKRDMYHDYLTSTYDGKVNHLGVLLDDDPVNAQINGALYRASKELEMVYETEPIEETALPTGAQERKDVPVASGVLDYFPLAIAEIARLSQKGNDQHNPGQPLHWDRFKSTDHADCLARHFLERGVIDGDGMSHTVKVAWRALAMLQEELEVRNHGGQHMDRNSVENREG